MKVPWPVRPSRVGSATAILSSALWLVLQSGCGLPPVPVPKTSERYDFEAGKVALQSKRWLEAQTFLKRFLNQHPGHALADSAQYLLGTAQFSAKSFAEAAVEYALLVREFPRSELRDDASIEECRCYFEQMRPPQLDPTFALRTRSCLNEFLLRYPESPHKSQALELLTEIADRLAEKEYRLATMFVNRKLYRSALIYADEILREYPASSWVPQALLLRGRCLQETGDPAGAADAWQRLIDNFPDHPATVQARSALRRMGHESAGEARPDAPDAR